MSAPMRTSVPPHGAAERSARERAPEAAGTRRRVAERRVGARHDVHDAADRVAAVHRRARTAKDLDPLDHRDGHGEIERIVAALHVAHAHAVHQHDDLVEGRPAEPQVGLRRRALLRVHAEREAEHVGERAGRVSGELRAREDLEGSRRGDDGRIGPRDDVDGVDLLRDALRGGRACETRRAEQREHCVRVRASHVEVPVGSGQPLLV